MPAAANPWLTAYQNSPAYGQKPMAAAAAPTKKGNGSLISVLPSILAAGASFVPGVGTVAAAGLGGAGELLRQKLNGEDMDLGKAGEEAALSAIPGGLGLIAKGAKAAKAISVTTKGLKAASTATKDMKLADTIAEVSGTAGKMTRAGKADATANKLLASQYGTISKPVARSVDLNGTVGTLAKYGVTKPEDAERIAGQFTGGDGIVSKAVRSSVGDAKRVNTDGIRDLAESALTDNQVVGAKAKGFKDYLTSSLLKLAGGSKGSLEAGAHPSDVLDVIKRLESKSADLLGKGGTYHLPTSEDKALAKVHSTMADELKDRLYANADIKKVLTPQLRDQLVELHPGNDKWASFVDGTVMKSKDVGSLRSTMKPFVNISKAIGEADTNMPTFGGTVGNAVGGKGLAGQIAQLTLGSNPVKRTAAGVIKGADGVASKVKSGATKTARAALIGSDLPGQSFDQADPSTMDPTALTLPDTTAADQPAAASSDSAFSNDKLEAMAIADIQATGGKNLAKIAQLKTMFGDNTKSAKPVSSATNQQIANATSGLEQLKALQATLASDPGAAGKNALASVLPGAAGNVARGVAGTQDFNTSRNEIVDVLARLRTGAAISKTEEAQYKQMLPSAGDSPTTIQHKLSIYQQLFEGILARAQAGGDETSL